MSRRSSNPSNWKQWNVAVTGVNARAESPGPGCAVARCLREHDAFQGRTIGFGYDMLDAGLYARDVCDGGYLIPYPSAGEEALLQRITQIHRQEKLDAIIPCLDAEILNFIAIKDDLGKMGIRMLLPKRQQFLLRAKNQLASFCAANDVLAPETKTIADPGFFDNCESEGWKYPLIVKGIFYDAAVAHDPTEARSIFYRLVTSWGYPVLVQKLVQGDEFDLAGLGDGLGGLLGHVTMRKRGLTDKGKAWAGVTVIDEAILQVSERLTRALKWRGPFEVEVMKARDGKIYLIEINPRFPAWIYLSHAVDRNLPIALLRVLANDPNLDLAPISSGTFFIRYAQELIMRMDEFEEMYIQGGIGSSARSAPRTTQTA
jgi:carbamoyl-phosphate synthase large subunit